MRSKKDHKLTILNQIRKNCRLARPEISRSLGLSFPAVTNLTKELIRENMIIESGFCEPEGGRRAAYLVLNPEFIHAVGIEISGSGLRTVIADFSGNVLENSSCPINGIEKPEQLLEKISSEIESIMNRNEGAQIRGIGIGIAGIIDRQSGTSIKFPHLGAWSNVPIGNVISERLSLETFVENDVLATTLAELRYGLGRSEDNFFLLHIGRGIRLGLVINGEIYHGATGNAGEIGHTLAQQDGPICYCGNYGCLESISSPPAMVRQTQEALKQGVESSLRELASGDYSRIDIGSIFEAAQNRDRLANNVLERAAESIGVSVANVANIFNPGALVLSGIIREKSGIFVETLCRVFSTHTLQSLETKPKIEVSALSNSPCALGAATLTFESYFK